MNRYLINILLFFAATAYGQQNRMDFLLDKLNDGGKSDYVMIIAHRGDWRNAPENSLQAYQSCIDAGFDTIEHGTFMTLDHAKQMAEKGIAWTPTIMAYTYLYELCKENIEKNGDAPVSDPVMQKEMENYEFFEPAYKAYRENFMIRV